MTSLAALIPPQTIAHTKESANDLDDLWQSCLHAAEDGTDQLLYEFHELGERLIKKYNGSSDLLDELILLRSDIEMGDRPALKLLLMKHVVELAILGFLVD